MKERKTLKWATIMIGLCIGGLIPVLMNLDEPIDSPLGKYLLFILAISVIELFASIILFIVYLAKKSKNQVASLQRNDTNNVKQCPVCHANLSAECTICPYCKNVL